MSCVVLGATLLYNRLYPLYSYSNYACNHYQANGLYVQGAEILLQHNQPNGQYNNSMLNCIICL